VVWYLVKFRIVFKKCNLVKFGTILHVVVVGLSSGFILVTWYLV